MIRWLDRCVTPFMQQASAILVKQPASFLISRVDSAKPKKKPENGKKRMDGTAIQHATWMRQLAENRDRAAFANLFDHFAPRVKAYLMRSGSDAEAAEELMQEAMLTVWRRAESFDAKQASVATWVFTIARNKRIDVYRRTNRPDVDMNDPALVPEAEQQPDDALSDQQESSVLRRAIKELPAEQAKMLRMAFYEDKAHSEIADETGLPLGTVKSRLRLAIGRMRKMVTELEPSS